jgi:tricorn protease
MRKLLTLLLCTIAAQAVAQESPLWLRYPAISPDGKTIIFSYQGDLYRIPAAGGSATPLSVQDSYEFMPVWSHDGKQIAFASDRYGNFDVFLMPAEGGEAKRLTYHSGADLPSDFTPDDKEILFNASRTDLSSNMQFPRMAELYQVNIASGKSRLLSSLPAIDARYDASGKRIIYHDYKGYEDNWRKHHTSSVTRDIWTYEPATGKYQQLSTNPAEDRNPVFTPDGIAYYYLSERGGNFNVYKATVANNESSTPVTKFRNHPVRFLTTANDNTLCFTYDGEIYTMKEGSEPKKIKVSINLDGRTNIEKIVPVNGSITEMVASPNGKEVAYVVRGEIFVSSVEGGITKRITNTPWQERMVDFSPDGKTLVYAAEKNNNWNIYTKSIPRTSEPYFYASTVLKEEEVIATDKEEFQPQFSPDGKEIAYLEERTSIRIYNIASKTSRTILPERINYSYSDGDQNFTWSPDSKWILTDLSVGMGFLRDIALISADGKGTPRNITNSGYQETRAEFNSEGNGIALYSTRESGRGENAQPTMGDVFGLFLSRDAWDNFKLNKDDYTLWKELDEKKKKADTAAKKISPNVMIEWDGLDARKARLTTQTTNLSGFHWNDKTGKLIFISNMVQGPELWQTDLRTRESKQLAKLEPGVSGMQVSKDGKTAFVLMGGKIAKFDTETGKRDNVSINGEMNYNAAGEREYVFDHAWRQVLKKFYVENLHDVDWSSYYKAYRKFLPYVQNNYDFADMLGEMLGELNGSHTGCRYNASRPNTDATASLGIFMDHGYKGDGVMVAEVISGGPLDKASLTIKKGNVITAIDGQQVTGLEDYFKLLNRKADKFTLITMLDPATKKTWEESVKPVSQGDESELLYKRWVKMMRDEVHRLSNGKLGYVHVRGMNDASMRVVVEDALGLEHEKQALVVDTRFNGGGNLHEQLSDFLNGKKYMDIIPHGQQYGVQPGNKWIKPSIVLMSESNYSDAHLFPVAYKIKNIGKTVGMPVPGTGTFVWWETQIDPTLVFGIPQGGWRTMDGKFCENNQLEPDIRVKHDHQLLVNGRDLQLEAAVKELLK